ncbi:hypothetical protein B0I72DRAFT_132624 [Yarrowia lipolytica]|uniref:Uncharacterized protein n=1 Tax=Yarrowia lipolytica TaxID=4952 RepID=A0A371C7H4_YARLL|nr:hypothetical protein BKA91DRAFT_136749 [Yarrowia lipolytica]KAE8173316.1 hypothetical protein BKA90DRAFT_135884 [Yarrowia lipolytica]RDW25950.1 hypothetical protein B0I71DRAFT_131694 [Yarrowia lipolytica]RDW35688.1 hypothetical protein B0I72DRAFT_132624 [Yarrowia lipolytica]RDW40750.1 hypothetical protein B0I73DRAFT_129721 [Yarrowia lipolytica]
MYRMKCEAEKHCLLAQTIAVLQVLSMAFIYRIVAPPHLHNPHLHYPLQPYMHGRRRSLGLARSRLDPLVFVSAYFSPTAFVLCRFCGSIFFPPSFLLGSELSFTPADAWTCMVDIFRNLPRCHANGTQQAAKARRI